LKAIEYAAAVEKFAWDGSWYRRAFTDEGTPIGSSLNQNAKLIPLLNHGQFSAAREMTNEASVP
jgi:cellobiose phosphorylase